MDNLEEVLHSLNEFDRTVEKDVSPELEHLLQHIAKTGRTVFPWPLLKPLIRFKLEKVLTEFFESGSSSNAYISDPTSKSQDFLPTVQKLITNLNCFSGTPFTIQRICELITEPRKHYKTTDKFLRGVEKNILVVSTVQPDGSLITRSVGPHLTNGTVSPTESTAIPINPISFPPAKPSYNSLLNTSFQENGSNSNVPDEQEVEGDKVKTNSEVNGSPSGQADEKQCTMTEQDSKESPENIQGEKDSTSEKKEGSDISSIPENVANSTNEPTEEVPEEQTELLEKKVPDAQPPEAGNEEKPAIEPKENKNDEKMDES